MRAVGKLTVGGCKGCTSAECTSMAPPCEHYQRDLSHANCWTKTALHKGSRKKNPNYFMSYQQILR